MPLKCWPLKNCNVACSIKFKTCAPLCDPVDLTLGFFADSIRFRVLA